MLDVPVFMITKVVVYPPPNATCGKYKVFPADAALAPLGTDAAKGSLWAAAGHPHAVFNLTPQQLQQMTGAEVADVAAGAPA